MPTKLKFFTRDPNGLNRGSGLYYLRGGKSSPYLISRPNSKDKRPKGYASGPYYSKYSQSRDKAKKSRGYDIDPVGIPRNVAKNYAHLTDGNLNKRRR